MSRLLAVLCVCLLAGCAEIGDSIKAMDLTVAPKADVVVAVQEVPKPLPVAQRKWPEVCKPAAARLAKVHKVDGGKTPPEAIEAAFTENKSYLVKGAGERRQCFCWAVSEGLVNIAKEDAEKQCKGVKIPKVAS